MPNPQHRPAPATTMPRSVEGRSAVVVHDHHIVPDTLAGPGLVLAPHGMTAQPPFPIGHGHLGDLMGDYHHQGGWTADDRHQGGTVRANHPQKGHPLNKKSQAVQEDWFRNYWKHHQLPSLWQHSLTWRLWLKLWLLPYWLS